MLVSLLGYFFCMITTLTAVVALLINFSNSNSAFEKGHLPRPIIVQTVTADETAPWRSPVTKEASAAKDVSPVVSIAKTGAKESTQHKPKVLARQRNNYGYGNEYAYRNDPRGFFIH
jgi:hypothetical protein